MIRASLLIFIAILFLPGCVARLPERPGLAANAIPELSDGNSRMYIYMGTIYIPSGVGGHIEYDLAAGVDAHVYVNNKLVSYINEDAIIVDLAPDTYTLELKPVIASEEERNKRRTVPYSITLEAGDVRYLEANVKDVSSQASKWLGVAGGAIGGAIQGYNLAFEDYFEEEPKDGPKNLAKMDIAEYIDLSTTHQTSSPVTKTPIAPENSLEDRLASLKRIYDQELITKEQYEAKRQQLLEEL